MTEIDDETLFGMIQKLSNGVTDVEPLVTELMAEFDALSYSRNPQHATTLNANYAFVLQKIDQLIKSSQDVINLADKNLENEQNNNETDIPQTNQNNDQPKPTPLQKLMQKSRYMFEYFISRTILVSQLPYPPLCGSIPADPNQKLDICDFVAAKFENDYVLSYIIGYEGDDYIICDADNDEPQCKTISPKQVIPLPKSVPDRNFSHAEYSNGTKVLALWPNDEDDWTSLFYPAVVSATPTSKDPNYTLMFDGSEVPMQVKQHFVVHAPSK
ncbi:hypothetical protein TVAG_355640 [Trichomonas vaginalis G3]|uniref:SGF29 C-terminal domain-containing protein n=1 Tax=Trichomonas vaginalis (strain ATCC PRA-98 / G3) TaxID=412133 RepID=A2FJT7_TRIV3|nr:methylated histone binding [Trichomonas vaginalis G3]EAX94828.1 hypothetical protein TVAG_355640 [Trichomonas vaginalis G3]KAI5532168.1 methylated histone binding [Trichomonas vaginalis G3]|eukprot:XP_001307758.1 hypothetical protein [Trichomonas vaginalis G3]